MASKEARAHIIAEAERLGRPVSAEEANRLSGFFALLKRWGSRMRLTGSHDLVELIEQHLADAFMMSRELGSVRSFVDVGSGGGLPAIPYMILEPAGRALLVEVNKRKAAFLRTAVHQLGIAACEVADVRVEELGVVREGFEIVSSRATFAPEQWLEKARALGTARAKVIVFVARTERLPAEGEAYSLGESWSYALVDGSPRTIACYHLKNG